MKIAYCLPDTFRPGGIERIISLKANYLAEINGYEIYIITTGQKDQRSYYHYSPKVKMIDLNVNYDEMESAPFLRKMVMRWKKRIIHKRRLDSFLKSNKFDVVVSVLTHEADFLPKIKDGSKKVLEFHFSRGHKIQYAKSFEFSTFLKMVYWLRTKYEEFFITEMYDKFVVLTEEDLNNWHFDHDNVIAIPNMITFESSKCLASLDSKIALAVGRLDAQKGFDRLLRIWKEFTKISEDWVLHIYGDGKDKCKLLAMINDFGIENCVKLFPSEPNIKDKYLDASLFLMTSRYEGMPMTLMEAMSLGLPCVSYSFKCGPMDLIKNNINGILVDDGDQLAFVDAVVKLTKSHHKMEILGKEAAKCVRSKYSSTIVMNQWRNLFNNLA